MVYVELVDPNNDDFGKKIVRISPELREILKINEKDIVEIIFKGKRVGVIAIIDPLLSEYRSITPEEEQLLQSDKLFEPRTPKPGGVDYTGSFNLSASNLHYFRLDGELRTSLGISIGDIVEIDTTIPPPENKICYINIIEKDSSLMIFEQKQVIFQLLKEKLVGKPISSGLTTAINIGFKEERILIQATIPDGISILTEDTEFRINDYIVTQKESKLRVNYDKIGGLKHSIQIFRHLVEFPLKKPDLFDKLKIRPPKGILVSGPSGVGKSLLIEALANETGITVTTLPPNLFSGIGITEQNIRNFFDDILEESKFQKVILLMDNLDTLTPAQYINQPEFEKRFTIQFALALEKLKSSKNIVTIGTCSSVEKVHPMMRKIGRFDIELELGMPNEAERREILKIHLRSVPKSKDINDEVINYYASQMYGFSGADIALFIKEAGLNAINRNRDIFLNFKQIPSYLLIKIKITKKDFERAFLLVEPSGLKSIHSLGELPNFDWDDIGGLTAVKNTLKENIEWQFKYPELFDEMGISKPRGLLLYGPPGTGKTLVAKAIASQINANFLAIKGPELLSMWFGDSARLIRELFQRARKLAPAIIFFDEIDALAPKRGTDNSDVGREVDATVNQLLTLLDGMDTLDGVFIIGATNRPDAIDIALMRPGRLDKLVQVPMPNEKDRYDILKIHTKKIPIENKDEVISDLIPLTDGYTGADIENLCREAVISCLREKFSQRNVRKDHFLIALELVTPSVNERLIEYYDNFTNTLTSFEKPDILSKQDQNYL